MSDDGDDDYEALIAGGFDNLEKAISSVRGSGKDSGAIQHAEDAIDYEDVELSDEELPDEEPSGNNQETTSTRPETTSTTLPTSLTGMKQYNEENKDNMDLDDLFTPPPSTSFPTVTSSDLTTSVGSLTGLHSTVSSAIPSSSITTQGIFPTTSVPPLGHDFFSLGTEDLYTSQREKSLEERVGSDYAAAVAAMTFDDDDWFGNGLSIPPATGISTADFTSFNGLSQFPTAPNTNIHGDIPLPASLGLNSSTGLPGSVPFGIGQGLGADMLNAHSNPLFSGMDPSITLPGTGLPASISNPSAVATTAFDMNNPSNLLSQTDQTNTQTAMMKLQAEEQAKARRRKRKRYNMSITEIVRSFTDDPTKEDIVESYYPDFRVGRRLDMNSMFGPKGRTLALPKPKNPKPVYPSKVNLEVEPDQKVIFKRAVSTRKMDPYYGHTIEITPQTIAAISDSRYPKLEDLEKMEQHKRSPKRLEEDILIATADWNLSHLWEDSSDSDIEMENVEQSAPNQSNSLSDSDSDDDDSDVNDKVRNNLPIKTTTLKPNTLGTRKTEDDDIEEIIRPSKRIKIYHPDMYDSEDEEGFFEGVFKFDKSKVILDMNDPMLLFTDDTQSMSHRLISFGSGSSTKMSDRSTKNILQRYNISNDRAYDLLKENHQSKIRSIISDLTIDHSMVAQRLQSPHYKVKLSKAQMRSFHRPAFHIKPNTVIHFSKIKQRKRKRDKGKPITELLAKTTDLTLGDSAQFFLLEYSEEFPLVLSNFGMGNKLINYYRKTSPDDRTRPKLPTGETNVLGVEDKSAFWNFGYVEPGNVVPTLYNKMIRAPIFKHEPKNTDFVLIRSTGGGQGVRYFLRSIPYLFTVGQTFPVIPIPGPHSRKVTTASKNRLKMVVFRLLNKSERHRIAVRDISPHFPDHNEMQNRQRLKEFMEFQRTGEDQGYWKIKSSEPLPTEEAIRLMISPEDIALLEAMQVGQQHLEDAGYGKTIIDDREEGEDSIEEQLAPWHITRNFINATQGKAMLQLHGEGDPSGSGEAFSFLRTSMKGGFRAVGESVNERLDKSKFGGHSYNVALQQKAYDEEIKRIWYTQAKSLSNPSIEHLTWDEADMRREDAENQSVAPTPQQMKTDTDSLFSHNSTATQQSKVLRITRFRRDENGTLQREVETITDRNLIRAYVSRRHKLEDELMAYVLIFKENIYIDSCFTNFLLTFFFFLQSTNRSNCTHRR